MRNVWESEFKEAAAQLGDDSGWVINFVKATKLEEQATTRNALTGYVTINDNQITLNLPETFLSYLNGRQRQFYFASKILEHTITESKAESNSLRWQVVSAGLICVMGSLSALSTALSPNLLDPIMAATMFAISGLIIWADKKINAEALQYENDHRALIYAGYKNLDEVAGYLRKETEWTKDHVELKQTAPGRFARLEHLKRQVTSLENQFTKPAVA